MSNETSRTTAVEIMLNYCLFFVQWKWLVTYAQVPKSAFQSEFCFPVTQNASFPYRFRRHWVGEVSSSDVKTPAIRKSPVLCNSTPRDQDSWNKKAELSQR